MAISTTIKQSKELVRLGLDPKTADMFYFSYGMFHPMKLHVGNILEDVVTGKRQWAIPAWSLSALLRVLPLGTELNKMRNDAHEIYYEIDCPDATGWVGYEDSDPITAAYEMVCCLLEQGLIKKGGQDD